MYFKTDEREFSCIVSIIITILYLPIWLAAHAKFTLHTIEFTVVGKRNVCFCRWLYYYMVWPPLPQNYHRQRGGRKTDSGVCVYVCSIQFESLCNKISYFFADSIIIDRIFDLHWWTHRKYVAKSYIFDNE